jgi:hypothetical protein
MGHPLTNASPRKHSFSETGTEADDADMEVSTIFLFEQDVSSNVVFLFLKDSDSLSQSTILASEPSQTPATKRTANILEVRPSCAFAYQKGDLRHSLTKAVQAPLPGTQIHHAELLLKPCMLGRIRRITHSGRKIL